MMKIIYYFILRIIIKATVGNLNIVVLASRQKRTNGTEKIPEIFSYVWTSN